MSPGRALQFAVVVVLGWGCDRASPSDRQAPASGRTGGGPGTPATVPCEVRSVPEGAAVFLDGKATGLATPARVEVVAGRPASLSVKLPGFLLEARTVEPEARRCEPRDFELRAGVTLAVETRPPGAEVHVGPLLVLTSTPGSTEPLAPGLLPVAVHKDGFVDVFKNVAAPDAGTVRLELELVPAATVTVIATPPGAQVLVDGQPTAYLTPADVTLTPRARHQLTVTKAGWSSVTRVVKTGPVGSRDELEVTLVDQARAGLERRVARAEAGIARARATLKAAQAREEASELKGRTNPALVQALERAYQGVERAQNELDEAEAGRDSYDVLHPPP